MSEIKSFFVEDNTLNKGYAANSNNNHKWSPRKRVNDILPPPDVLAVYEDMHPGTFEKILAALDKEQQHQHQMNELSLRMQMKAQKMGRIFALLIVSIISYAALEFAQAGMLTGGLIFTAISFICMGIIFLLTNKNTTDRTLNNHRRHNNHHQKSINTPDATPQPSASTKPDNRRRRRK